VVHSVVLTEEQIYDWILEILSAERLIELDLGGKREVLVFTAPFCNDKLEAAFHEKQALKQAIAEGCFLEEDIPEEFVRTFFSVEDEEELRFVEGKVQAYENLLRKRIKGSDSYKADEKKLQEFKNKRSFYLSKRSTVNQFSAEFRAREERMFTLLSRAVRTLDRNLKWTSKTDMMESMDSEFVYTLLSSFLEFYWGPETSVIRKIARSGQWRNIYLAASKLSSDLFGRSFKDLWEVQLSLLSYSAYYDSIYNMSISERPSEDLIEDDEKLDRYMDDLTRKIKAEERVRERNSISKSKLQAKDQDHVIVTADSKDYVKFHKEEVYSDTNVITRRAKGDNNTYSDVDEMRAIRLKKRKNSKR
jgi:hypothetical protein